MSFARTPFFFGLLAMLATSGAFALPEDRNKPIRIQADTAELDERRGVAIYRGDVVITQGTLKITGNTVTITQDRNGEVELFTAAGKPAYYEQQPAVDKPLVKAYGLTIQYFADNERIVLIDQAKVVQENNTFEGEKIVYDTRRQVVTAGRASNAEVTTPRPRIDMVIQPRKQDEQPAEAEPSE